MLYGTSGFGSIGCCDGWYACSLCTVWVLSPFLSIFSHMPFQVCFLWLSFFLVCILFVVCIMAFHLFLYNITWVALCILFPFSFLFLHGVYIVGIMGLVWWEVLFCCICTTTSLSIPCGPYNVYSSFFLSCFVCLFLLSHMLLVCFFSPCVCFVHAWRKTFGGVCICIICSYV